MNSEHLGDALDHWKGSLLSLLVDKRLIRQVLVEPMITDPQKWPSEDIETYKRLLKLEIIFHDSSTFPSGKRKDYFNAVPKDGDIFLDPDIGIARGNPEKGHITVPDIINMLSEDRVVMVYQHSGQRAPKQKDLTASSSHQWLVASRNKITADGTSNVHCTVYECKQVAMFFVSHKKSRIDEIQTGLQEYLKGKAKWRVWQ